MRKTERDEVKPGGQAGGVQMVFIYLMTQCNSDIYGEEISLTQVKQQHPSPLQMIAVCHKVTSLPSSGKQADIWLMWLQTEFYIHVKTTDVQARPALF